MLYLKISRPTYFFRPSQYEKNSCQRKHHHSTRLRWCENMSSLGHPALPSMIVRGTSGLSKRRRRHESVAIVGKWLNRVVQVYFNYHAVPGNLYRLAGMRSEIGHAWRHALIRRSQRHRLPRHRFSRIKERFIPTVRNMHPHPEERFYASHT